MDTETRLRRAIPNALTLGNLLCGATALSLIYGGAPRWQAALVVGAGLLFDLLDGRAARRFGADNDFGAQLDSLADVVTFGAVPAAAAYQWKLHALGLPGAWVAGAMLAAAALRLARFNVEASAAKPTPAGPARFTGLAVTIPAATVLAAAAADLAVPPAGVAIACVGLAAAMVSTLPYRSFKDRPLMSIAAPAVCVVGIAVALCGAWVVGVGVGVATLGAGYALSAPIARLAPHRRG